MAKQLTKNQEDNSSEDSYSEEEQTQAVGKLEKRENANQNKQAADSDSSASEDSSNNGKKVKQSKNRNDSDSEEEQKSSPAKRNNAEQSGQQIEVIVSNLPFNATENDIKNHFKSCKSLLAIKILMGSDGRPRGKAFIKFETTEDMNKAIELNDTQLNGRTINVEQTRPRENFNERQNNGSANTAESQNIIVRNLPFSVDEDSLRDAFNDCGEIKGVRIMKNEEGRSKGFGFVDFQSVDAAKRAVKKSGLDIQGREVNVEFSLPRGPGGYQGGNRGGNRGGFGGNRGGFGGNRGGYGGNRGGFNGNRGGNRY